MHGPLCTRRSIAQGHVALAVAVHVDVSVDETVNDVDTASGRLALGTRWHAAC
jgi:hypothetical protein